MYFNFITWTSSLSSSDCSTWQLRLSPPFSFCLKRIFGGFLFSLIPKPSSSCSIIFLCPRGFNTSRQMKIKWQVRATAITCLPRPLPSLAPSIIPGKSNSCIFAPWTNRVRQFFRNLRDTSLHGFSISKTNCLKRVDKCLIYPVTCYKIILYKYIIFHLPYIG